MTRQDCQVAIVGGGPYGLAAAAHLRAAGIETHVFGDAMTFWQHQMPAGMYLRSAWEASYIADPRRELTLDAYEVAQGVRLSRPLPLDDFVAYGQWFQRQAVADLDRRTVMRVEGTSGAFRVLVEDGESLCARRVVIATGIAPFVWRPPQFDGLPASLAFHSSEHRDLTRFSGRQVLVIGGGQSALESAALLHEAGADVQVLVRAPLVYWLGHGAWMRRHGGPLKLLYAPTDVGPPGLSWIVALPNLFRRLPRELQERIARRSIRPAGAAWLPARLAGVPITTGRTVVSAAPSGERLRLRLDDGSDRCVDHVLLATGYRVDVARHTFLAPELSRAVRCIDGYPILAPGFESSVAGLHFLGAPAALSFGPLMRFVSGTGYASRALTRGIAGERAASASAMPVRA